MTLSRSEQSRLAEWWFTVDRVLLATVLVIAGTGLLLSLAASPAIALKRGLPTFYFVERHFLFAAVGLATMFGVSLLTPAQVRRLALTILCLSFGLMLVVLLSGLEINGARRWLHVGGYTVQPSEFAKPAFVVLSAWLFAEADRRPDMPATSAAVAIYLLFAALLVLQPDLGQTLLVSLVWCALFFLANRPLKWFTLLLAALGCALVAAYFTFGHVRWRIDRFLNPALGDSFQTDRALRSFGEGGLFGKGPGEGTVKTALPDAHTDFIFAVIAEEYGVLACLVILGLFALLASRVLLRQRREPDAFARLAATGLALLIVLQAIINMSVNVGLAPAKGITLPFISSGGSSMLGIGLAIGMLLAVNRRRADPAYVDTPHFVPKPAPYGSQRWWQA
jgi:cell division protein FtsW